MVSKSDRELIVDVQNGNILAFETLVRRYEFPLLRFVARILNNEEDAQEVTQDTFLNVYKGIDRIDPTRKFSSYLYTAGKNLAITLLRAKKKEFPLNEEILEDGEFDGYHKIIKEEEKDKVRKAISYLGKKYQKIVKLYYFNDLSYKEIAIKLSIPINTVRTHLRRAKGELRKVLENEEL